MTAKLHLEGFSFENMKDKLGAVVRSLTSYHRAKGSSTQPFYKNTGIRLATIISLGPYSRGSLSFFFPRKYPGRSGASTELEDLFYLVLGFSLIRFSLMYRLLVLEFRYNGR